MRDALIRLLRGGSWGYGSGSLRSAERVWVNPSARDDDFGVRVAALPR